MREGGRLAFPPPALVSTLRFTPSLGGSQQFSQVVLRLATSVQPDCRCRRFQVRCTARPEWQS